MSNSPMTVPSTQNSMEAGTIHVERSARLPAFLQFGVEPIAGVLLKGWSVLRNVRSTLDAEILKAGWTSFFMAGKIERTSFGVDQQKTLSAALGRVARYVKSENCNGFEIMHVTTRRFLGIVRVTVAAHARRLQEINESMVCFGH